MEKNELTLMIHAQKGCTYTRHRDIRVLERYAPEAIHLVSKRFKESLFKTKVELPVDPIGDGSFNAGELEPYLDLDPEKLNRIRLVLVGGELEVCLTKAYHCVDIWQRYSPFPTVLETHLPLDAVFSYNRTEQRISTLREMSSPSRKDKELTSITLMFYCFSRGTPVTNMQWEENAVVLRNKKPYGIFDVDNTILNPLEGLLLPRGDLR